MIRRLCLALPALALVLVLAPYDVAACGGFFRRASTERRPSLSYEQALIVHDPQKGEEHFVREVAFRGGLAPFGFVVPTPSRPEVAKVEQSPFRSLREAFPFESTRLAPAGAGVGFGAGHGRHGGGTDGVTVLEVSKVGSFTAFVLAADDARGLARWLADNGLVSTPEADVWLAHYVRMRFYYVAMRYDPPKPEPGRQPSGGIKAETIRISFATPVPYYPYFEPRPPAGGPPDRTPQAGGDEASGPSPRLLELWLVSSATLTPIAAKAVAGKTSWTRPMQGGQAYTEAGLTRSRLEAALAGGLDRLLPGGDLVVQTFQDQKTQRDGYGDVLFAPEKKAPLDPAREASLRRLLGILDPALVPEGKP